MAQSRRVSELFPDFPWDTIAAAKARAAEHPGGIVDLSIGTPVDPTPAVAREALVAAADSPGYPTVLGPESLRQAVVDWLERRFAITGVGTDNVLATIGSKELIANLCVQLGLGPGDVVGIPETAYPTYAVSAAYAGATAIATDSRVAFGPQRPNAWGLGPEIRGTKSPHWTGSANSPETFGHFGQSGTFLWVDPEVRTALVVLTDELFGPWATTAWPELADAVLAAIGSITP